MATVEDTIKDKLEEVKKEVESLEDGIECKIVKISQPEQKPAYEILVRYHSLKEELGENYIPEVIAQMTVKSLDSGGVGYNAKQLFTFGNPDAKHSSQASLAAMWAAELFGEARHLKGEGNIYSYSTVLFPGTSGSIDQVNSFKENVMKYIEVVRQNPHLKL